MNTTTEWLQAPAATPDDTARQAAEARQAVLTKPPGALGLLEQTAIRLAALQGSKRPSVEQLYIAVFAADHGVVAEGISAFPQAVTTRDGEKLRPAVALRSACWPANLAQSWR